MTDKEQQIIETTAISTLNDEKQILDNSENVKENELNSLEQSLTHQLIISEDIRYSTEQTDHDKLMGKYENYQVSQTNACNIRFLADHRQKQLLFGRPEEENTNVQKLAKTFCVNMFPGYQQPKKHSYKIFGTEANVRRCLIEIMNRMFNKLNHSTQVDCNENINSQTTDNIESTNTKEIENKKSSSQSTTIFVTTINTDSSITEEKKSITPSTEEFVSIEHKQQQQYTFIMLISSQGQDVLRKNWSPFAGLLQQRLNVLVTNPVKLPKFGGKQIHNELSITGESIDSLTDACLQIIAFINDILGVPIQTYKYDEEIISNDNNQIQRQGRIFFNRNRNGIFEQMILIRSDCVARIIGTRGANLKRIQTKCHLREMTVARQANAKGYVECTLTAYQARNLNFAIDTIRSFLRKEDHNAVLIVESKSNETNIQDSPRLQSDLEQTSFELSQKGSHFLMNLNPYPQPSYNFQNTPSFDFTHQATSASRKTDKRRGDLHDLNKTPTESQNSLYENISSSTYSPKHQSKRSCPVTKEIDCTTDEGFWISKQYYHALDETSKELFDSLIEKLDKIRIANEENVARKQQRLVGRNRPNKSRVYHSSNSYLKEDNNRQQKNSPIKATQNENLDKIEEQSTDEKENQQKTSPITINQN